ncbi:MAG: GNAT family N-acetyltransferase [Gemmatimonadales bacterium]|nr:GNAT family N-acetyltransferase [Gemmatimonadales bacterium]
MTSYSDRLPGLLAQWSTESEAQSLAGRILDLAEEIIEQDSIDSVERVCWCDYLALTRHPEFLTALADADSRHRWAETTFAVIEEIDFTLEDILRQRAAADPLRTLFWDLEETGAGQWNYEQILRRIRSTAALFLAEGTRSTAPNAQAIDQDVPRVAILATNSVGSACCDLACLLHDIFVTPLNIHFSEEDLVWIFDRLHITTAVCDHPERLDKLLAVREKTRRPFAIYTLHGSLQAGSRDIFLLEERRALLDVSEVKDILEKRPRFGQWDTATIMFTSGSTGRPKGVIFNRHNLVTKRFARAAALPDVGRDEVLLCYLPLYHTFGRYLEMLGSIFWGGTYVFSGNPSADTLLKQFQEVRPTALISVPVRWIQIRDRVREMLNDGRNSEDPSPLFRKMVGDRLYWGLSAAGYLDPKVFRWFHGLGVKLCSGFGMTEGTGGLTMTPPDDYVADSVGVPLPGVKVRFGDQDELQIAGPYIAHYLDDEGTSTDLNVSADLRDGYWLATGDLFRKSESGHLEIVDRIKDIYKNSKGQTIAPRKVESLFTDVPGIKRTFLAGDGRAYNTLLIVPDFEDPVLQSLTTEEDRREYFQRIVTTANPGLAAFERVVDFAILDRDFDLDRKELTAKGSFRRKTIEENFTAVIGDLYRSNIRSLQVGEFEVQIPLWFFRDLGILESAVLVEGNFLLQTENGTRLNISRGCEDRVLIGNLEYRLEGTVIDFGLMARQPLLWMANPALIAFCPCRIGWDVPLGPFGEQVFLPSDATVTGPSTQPEVRVDRQLADVDELCRLALFGPTADSLRAIRELDDQLSHVGAHLGNIIRRRLEALATHQEETVRCRAYQVLVLDQPIPDYLTYLPSFIESGLPFLDDESFLAIGQARIEPRRLIAFRQRLYSYRTQLSWPADDRTRRVFKDLFHLLADFGRFHTEFYGAIREELVSWVLHDEDPELAASAQTEFSELANWYEERLDSVCTGLDPSAWQGKIAFQDGLSLQELDRLKEVLIGTSFLKESVSLAFEGEDFNLDEIGPSGIWVSRIISRIDEARYRVSINTRTGKHFDLQVIIYLNPEDDLVLETIHWFIVLRGHPFGTPMLPRFGCCRPHLGALSMAYVSGLTVWEQVRKFSSVRGPGTRLPSRLNWQQLMIRAMSIVVKGWRNSCRRIIPGLVMPNNIIVPEPDFRRGALQNNLSGWKAYDGPLSLIRPLWRNIFQHTRHHYPWTSEFLEPRWIFEAYVEALGVEEAGEVLQSLQEEMAASQTDELGPDFAPALSEFLTELETIYYKPLALKSAVGRYREWEKSNTTAPLNTRLDIIEELFRLYHLDRMPEIARFTLFRQTLYRGSDLQLLDVFDRLLVRMFRNPGLPATQMVELSDLQGILAGSEDLTTFNRMAFPNRIDGGAIEVRTVGDPARGQVIVRSKIKDLDGRTYQVGEPAGPADVGQLYRLFLQAGFPKSISEADRYFVVSDEAEQIIGGVVYRLEGDGVAVLDGIVVNQILAERGISGAIMSDFCTRMKSLGCQVIKTHFFLRRFYQRHGFKTDPRRGGLVRYL